MTGEVVEGGVRAAVGVERMGEAGVEAFDGHTDGADGCLGCIF